jgi:hypothetical protein
VCLRARKHDSTRMRRAGVQAVPSRGRQVPILQSMLSSRTTSYGSIATGASACTIPHTHTPPRCDPDLLLPHPPKVKPLEAIISPDTKTTRHSTRGARATRKTLRHHSQKRQPVKLAKKYVRENVVRDPKSKRLSQDAPTIGTLLGLDR